MSPLRVKVKICGITNLKDAQLAIEAGADALGFIFFRKSPRWVSQKTVKEIVSQLPPFVESVGVFVNEEVDKVNAIAERCRLDVVQLHGEESPAYCKKITRKIVKAIRLKDARSLEGLDKYSGVRGFLLDAYSEKGRGGTGETCDWKLVKKAKGLGPVILAGGLNSENVREGIRQARPYGVDVSSGVEKSPGRKDFKKVMSFLKAVHSD